MAAPLACLLTLVIAGHALATTTWSPPVAVAGYGAIAGNRALVTLGTSTVVVAYVEMDGTANPGAYVRRSTDSGTTWESPQRLSSDDEASAPQISGHGTNVDVVWLSNERVRYARSIDSGVSFLPTVSLGAVPASTDYHNDTVRVARGPNGRVAVAWEACTAGRSVRVRVSIDGGASFGARHPLVADCGPRGHGVNLAVGTGVIYLSYRDYVPASPDEATRLEMVRSLDDGANWEAPVTLGNETRASRGTDIAAEGADAYITYVRDDGWVRYRHTTDRGETWTPTSHLAPTTGRHLQSPVISLRGGVVRAAYATVEVNGCDSDLLYRESADGSSWTAPQKIDTCSYPAGIGFAGRTVVLYTSYFCGPDECDGWELRSRTRTP